MERLLLSVSLLTLFYFSGGTSAAECTDAEDQSITDAYTAAAATSACSSYSSTGILILITPPCSATECVAVMEDLAGTIPNCTSGTSTSEKDQVLQSLSICATPAPTPASTASSTNCSSSQAEDTFNAFYEAANGSCASSTTIEAYSIIISTQCNSTCAAAVQAFAQGLPNCNYELSGENNNKKEDITTQFTYCEMLNNATNISVYVDSVDNLLGSAAGLTTAVVPNCTDEEIDETVAFYLAVATIESCIYDSSICANDIHVNTDCSTPCGKLLQRLGFDVPKCYFDSIDHRQTLSDNWYQCDWIVSPDNITISFHYSDTLNATANTTVSCNPDFDSTISSDESSFGPNSADSSAQKPIALWAIVSNVVFALAMSA